MNIANIFLKLWIIKSISVISSLNDHENIDYNLFVKIKTGKRTRGYDFTIVLEQSRLDVRKNSFSQRTVNEWNKL